MTLEPHDVHVWYRHSERFDDSAVDAALSILSPEERRRHDNLRSAADRRDYAAAHALLRTSLSRYADVAPEAWHFESDSHGKPMIADRWRGGLKCSFSLSHTRGLVACAIAPGSTVGIDVERTDPSLDWSLVVRRCFSPAEIAQVEHCPPLDRVPRFTEIWTLKEAHAKATGLGLSDSWPTFGFDVSGGRIRFMAPAAVEAESWQFALLTFAHYRLAVAVERPDQVRRTITARCSDDSGTGHWATSTNALAFHAES